MDDVSGRAFSGRVLRIMFDTPRSLTEIMVLSLGMSPHFERLLGRFERGARSSGGRAWIEDVGEFRNAPKGEAAVLYQRPLVSGEQWASEDADLTVLDEEWPDVERAAHMERIAQLHAHEPDPDVWWDPRVALRVLGLWALSESAAHLLVVPVGVGQVPSEQIRAGLERLAEVAGTPLRTTEPWFNAQWEHIANGVSLYHRKIDPGD